MLVSVSLFLRLESHIACHSCLTVKVRMQVHQNHVLVSTCFSQVSCCQHSSGHELCGGMSPQLHSSYADDEAVEAAEAVEGCNHHFSN